jgi:hypothetical protein
LFAYPGCAGETSAMRFPIATDSGVKKRETDGRAGAALRCAP